MPSNLSPGSLDSLVVQYPPSEIPVYLVQEDQLRMIAKGSDSLHLNIALASAGIALGAGPAAIAAFEKINSGKPIGYSDLFAEVALALGVVVFLMCVVLHRRNGKTEADAMIDDILSRRTVSPTTPIAQ